MERREALKFCARFPRGLIDTTLAGNLADALGSPLPFLEIVNPRLVRRVHTGMAVLREGIGQPLVNVAELAATVCWRMQLYAGYSHAMSSPHGTTGKMADYIGWRAAIRLAREFGGGMDEHYENEMVRDLYGWVKEQTGHLPPRALMRERPYYPNVEDN